MIALLLASLCLSILILFIGLVRKVWWTPVRVQYIMGLQGIKGPAYTFLYGSTKQILNMRQKSLETSMDLSHHIFPRILPHVYSWKQLYGKNYLNWHGPQAQLVVTEPELIREILNNRNGAYSRVEVEGLGKKLIGDGILASDGEKWLKLRKISNHAFHGESLKEMFPAMVASAETMLERWRECELKEIEVHEEFRLLTSEVISRTAFGSSYSEGKKIFDLLRKLGAIVSRNALKIRFPGIGRLVKSSDDIESDKLEQSMRELITGMIKKREERMIRGEADSYGSDFLGSLIKAYGGSDEDSKISVDTVISECKVFYIAGQETTNGLLAWSIFLLAIHPNWQEKAREEVLQVFGRKNPSPEGIIKLKTMSMILNETLRLYGPIVSMQRRVQREVRLGKLILPAKMVVSIPTLALHHDPQIWGQDAHLFRPERFAEGVAKATNNNTTAFIPFGFGPRTCVGFNFATNEAKIALSMILQRYNFTLSPTYVHSPFQLLTVRPQYGIPVIFRVI